MMADQFPECLVTHLGKKTMTIFESRIEDLTQDGGSHPGASGRQRFQTKGPVKTRHDTDQLKL